MLAGRIGGLRCGGPLFDLAAEKREKGFTLSLRVPRASPISSSVFHAASALSAPTGHLPLEGKADDTRENCYQ